MTTNALPYLEREHGKTAASGHQIPSTIRHRRQAADRRPAGLELCYMHRTGQAVLCTNNLGRAGRTRNRKMSSTRGWRTTGRRMGIWLVNHEGLVSDKTRSCGHGISWAGRDNRRTLSATGADYPSMIRKETSGTLGLQYLVGTYMALDDRRGSSATGYQRSDDLWPSPA